MEINIKVTYSISEFLEAIDKKEFDVIIYENEKISIGTSKSNGKKYCFVVFVQDAAEIVFKRNQLQKFESWDISHDTRRKNCYRIPTNSSQIIVDLKKVFTVKSGNKPHITLI